MSATASAHEAKTLSIWRRPSGMRPVSLRSTSTRMENDEEAMILEVVRELVREKVAPRAAEIDATGEVPVGHPEALRRRTICSAFRFRPSTAASAARSVTYVKVVEEVAKACASSALIVAVQELGHAADPDRRQRRTKEALHPQNSHSGEWVAAYALTEAGARIGRARFDAHARRPRRRRLRARTGTKIWITKGSVADIVMRFRRHRSRDGRERRQRVRRREGHAGLHRSAK